MTYADYGAGVRDRLDYGLDARDTEIRAARIEQLDAVAGPRVGDFIRFADGVERRISFITPPEWLPEVDSIQTSDGGSWYLGNGYVSFSGGLEPGIARSTLSPTDEMKAGRVWFFHYDQAMAHNGIDTQIMFRVYECRENAT